MHYIMVSVFGHMGALVWVLGVIALVLGVFGVNVFGSFINNKNLVGIVRVSVENFGQIWINVFVNFNVWRFRRFQVLHSTDYVDIAVNVAIGVDASADVGVVSADSIAITIVEVIGTLM